MTSVIKFIAKLYRNWEISNEKRKAEYLAVEHALNAGKLLKEYNDIRGVLTVMQRYDTVSGNDLRDVNSCIASYRTKRELIPEEYKSKLPELDFYNHVSPKPIEPERSLWKSGDAPRVIKTRIAGWNCTREVSIEEGIVGLQVTSTCYRCSTCDDRVVYIARALNNHPDIVSRWQMRGGAKWVFLPWHGGDPLEFLMNIFCIKIRLA